MPFKDPERARQYRKEYREKNKEKLLSNHRIWRFKRFKRMKKEEPEKYKEYFDNLHNNYIPKKKTWQELKHNTEAHFDRYPGRRQFKQYKGSANAKLLGFHLNEELFCSLLRQPCAFCGKPEANGIDRYDNDQGYTIENSVPCCWPCNEFKKSRHGDEYLLMCTTITEHTKIKIPPT